ncbi:hypothetical protein [Rhizobium sp. BK491]|uniref:hypothetical protein n=1 Tax=Rhizobium sp. BK491 TaxID=2587009 RepID=UPI0017D24A74|nr:hypothetical protein [Rhizobium sp. BK491]MBB3571830.1 transposase-like protein [Rhizobium sp. BK491]
MSAPPKRVFDSMLPRTRHYRPTPDTEDKALTIWLQGQFDEVMSLSEAPPRCPHCTGGETVLAMRAAHSRPRLQVFYCQSCDVHFRRTTGTPLAWLGFKKLDEFVWLLSQQRPITDAAEIIVVKPVVVVGLGQADARTDPAAQSDRLLGGQGAARHGDPSGSHSPALRLGGNPALSRL